MCARAAVTTRRVVMWTGVPSGRAVTSSRTSTSRSGVEGEGRGGGEGRDGIERRGLILSLSVSGSALLLATCIPPRRFFRSRQGAGQLVRIGVGVAAGGAVGGAVGVAVGVGGA